MADAVRPCEAHSSEPETCPDVVIRYVGAFDEYGLPVRDGGASKIRIAFCPFCGAALPASRRGAWFSEMARRGLEPGAPASEMPADVRGAEWWMARENGEVESDR